MNMFGQKSAISNMNIEGEKKDDVITINEISKNNEENITIKLDVPHSLYGLIIGKYYFLIHLNKFIFLFIIII